MTAELLAQNVVAHWMQAAGVAGAAWLGVSVLRLREPGFLLKYWQAVLLVLLLAPWVQPWQPAAPTPAPGLSLVEPERESASVAGGSVAESVVALPAERWSVDPWTWVLGLLAAVAVFRLVRLGLGLVRLGRLARSAHRVAPPTPARELLARFPTPATFIQPPDVRMPCSFGLFRPTVVLPAAFDRLEPAFQRGIVCHELLHLERRDFAAAVAEEVAAALLWFHPWAWLIRGRIRLHREQVVDAAVVRRTGERRAYLRCLIALAGHPRALPLAAPMLRPTELRARADALFEKDGTMSGRAAVAIAIGLGAALGAVVWAAAATVPLSAAATRVPLDATPQGPAPQEPGADQPSTGVTIALIASAWRPPAQEPGAGQPPAGVTIALIAGARGAGAADAGHRSAGDLRHRSAPASLDRHGPCEAADDGGRARAATRGWRHVGPVAERRNGGRTGATNHRDAGTTRRAERAADRPVARGRRVPLRHRDERGGATARASSARGRRRCRIRGGRCRAQSHGDPEVSGIA